MAAVKDVFTRENTPGRSTITQQLSRQLFPESVGADRSWTRKAKETLVALQIEKRYTKQEILTMYCNKVPWGNRAFGVQAASQLYFGKPAKDLTLDEAATIAGILPAPQRYNPYANVKAATARRNYTLDRMRDNGYITAEQAAAAKAKPIVTRGQPLQPPSVAPYFLENIRTELEERYGSKALYEGGLVIRTGLDADLQRAANRALDDRVRTIDRTRGYRAPDAKRHHRQARHRRLPASSLVAPDRRGRHRAGGGDPDRRAGSARPRRPLDWPHRTDRLRLDQEEGAGARQSRRSGRGPRRQDRRQGGDVRGHVRTAARARRRVDRDRQSHGRYPGDDRRVELRADAVQPRDAGDAPGGLALQAVRLHGGNQRRLHRRERDRGRAGQLQPGAGPAPVRAEELRPRIPRLDYASHGARRLAQRPDDQADGCA